MDHASRVQVLEGLGDLVDYKPNVHFLQYTLRNNVMKVRLHVLEYQVHILVVLGLESLVQLDYVRVRNLPQDLDFSVGALGIRRVLEGIENFLQGQHLLAAFFLHFPHMPIRP